MKKISIAGAVFTMLVLANHAFAHSGLPGHTHGFLNGVAHPVCGIDHVLAMIGVGIWSALAMPANRVLLAPIAFLAAMLVGAVAGVAGVPFAAVEAGMAISVVAMGLLIAARIKLPAAIAAAVIGAFGIMHGYAHGAEADGSVVAYMIGFTLTTAGLHFAGIGLGRGLVNLHAVTWAAGGAMALAGISLLVA